MDAQADLNLRWEHSHFVGFVMRRLIIITLFYLTRTRICQYCFKHGRGTFRNIYCVWCVGPTVVVVVSLGLTSLSINFHGREDACFLVIL